MDVTSTTSGETIYGRYRVERDADGRLLSREIEPRTPAGEPEPAERCPWCGWPLEVQETISGRQCVACGQVVDRGCC